MTELAIKAEQLSKRYIIDVAKRGDHSIAERLGGGLRGLLRSLLARQDANVRREVVWSLKDVSFEIKRGEVVGMIGRNGAGKSTLLKVMSRITEPTTGRAEIFGRVGTLLEVGTGFHPELTGRDNIYLSGIILGMTKAEIDKKFDEIVAFSDIEKYIDTPVKRYSSGMYVRLAFAVGAHLDPEILIVDEVLAVGDAQFQQKCMNKMHDIGEQGRTVIFVSHNMQAITRLCQRAILLDKGSIIADGPASQVASAYLHAGYNAGSVKEWNDLSSAPGDATVRLRSVRVKGLNGKLSSTIDIRQAFAVEMEIEVLEPNYVLTPAFVLVNQEGVQVFEAFDLDPDWRRRPRSVGRYVTTAWVPGNLLAEGTFFVSPACFSLVPHRVQFYEQEVIAFQVLDDLQGDSARGDFSGDMVGVVRPLLKWTTEFNAT